MEIMHFPSQYKKALMGQTKNTTIRLGDEIGTYKQGHTYQAVSYAGVPWDIRVKIIRIHLTTIEGLETEGIPKRSIDSLQRYGASRRQPAELIRFKVI